MFLSQSQRCSFCGRTLTDWSEHYAATQHANIDPWVPDDGDESESDISTCASTENDSSDFEPMTANRGVFLNGNVYYLFR
jgi:hypothetical protein